ncbi:MAG TPA: shikimate dehydrogenase [Aggregatilineales bacterium]|nr:shikimate dehydrogenase [Anaerolineales bacterium]HRE47201.1 shikimate dehydrogenase [Aggregatilineales bacterium]
MDGQTQLLGVMGYPIAHTLSPLMQNAALENLGLNWRYLPLLVHPEKLPDAVRGLSALGFRGVNVTVPHKVSIIPFLDSITDAVKIVGAVNTVRIDNATGKLEGLNTDMTGFLADIAANRVKIGSGAKVIVLGAGGAARAVGSGLVRSGCEVIFVNRTAEHADTLVEFLKKSWSGSKVSAASPDQLGTISVGATLIVNTTPVGMFPSVDRTPWVEDVPFPAGATVYDTVYRPLETRLMRDAKAAGLTTVGGVGMLVYQGAAAFEVWTGRRPNIEVMRAVCVTRLELG